MVSRRSLRCVRPEKSSTTASRCAGEHRRFRRPRERHRRNVGISCEAEVGESVCDRVRGCSFGDVGDRGWAVVPEGLIPGPSPPPATVGGSPSARLRWVPQRIRRTTNSAQLEERLTTTLGSDRLPVSSLIVMPQRHGDSLLPSGFAFAVTPRRFSRHPHFLPTPRV